MSIGICGNNLGNRTICKASGDLKDCTCQILSLSHSIFQKAEPGLVVENFVSICSKLDGIVKVCTLLYHKACRNLISIFIGNCISVFCVGLHQTVASPFQTCDHKWILLWKHSILIRFYNSFCGIGISVNISGSKTCHPIYPAGGYSIFSDHLFLKLKGDTLKSFTYLRIYAVFTFLIKVNSGFLRSI